jgi:hypothetical protein
MRKAAADVYSSNVAHDIVGRTCRELLKPFFGDNEASVSKEAASAFLFVGKLSTSDQADLLGAFIDANVSNTSPLAQAPAWIVHVRSHNATAR